jgi:hypothetical protein
MRLDQWIQHLERLGAHDPPRLPPEKTLQGGGRGEQLLWRACGGDPVDLAPVLSRHGARGINTEASSTLVPRDGPLLSPDGYLAIEVWAECELSALHALYRLVRERHPELPADAAARLDAATRWHLEHTQPDNSTNRPWALHVFLLAAHGSGAGGVDAGEAGLYAETLLHNMTATDARDEPLSRWILADAARELRRSTQA